MGGKNGKKKKKKRRMTTPKGKDPVFIHQPELARDSQPLLRARKPFPYLLEGMNGTYKFKIFSRK